VRAKQTLKSGSQAWEGGLETQTAAAALGPSRLTLRCWCAVNVRQNQGGAQKMRGNESDPAWRDGAWMAIFRGATGAKDFPCDWRLPRRFSDSLVRSPARASRPLSFRRLRTQWRKARCNRGRFRLQHSRRSNHIRRPPRQSARLRRGTATLCLAPSNRKAEMASTKLPPPLGSSLPTKLFGLTV
jgi:hypothetical protein